MSKNENLQIIKEYKSKKNWSKPKVRFVVLTKYKNRLEDLKRKYKNKD